MMFLAIILLCFTYISSDNGLEDKSNSGSFWQLSDIHYDTNYSSPRIAPSLCYLSDGLRNSSTGQPGVFGDYECDSSWNLVTSAIEAMKNISPNPDFILWTGDSIPHISDSVIDLEKIYTVVRNVTNKLTETFPRVPVHPMLGNHDVWPAHQIPINSSFYSDMLTKGGWSKMLAQDQQEIFKQGGFFSVPLHKHVRLICLNSNLWYRPDSLTQNVTDPAEQFHWLELQMQAARNLSEKVIFAGHVPPGVVGRAVSKPWMNKVFNQRFHYLLQRYSDIVTAAIFGHEHSDSFRIVFNSDGKPTVPLFLAPAVTPWNSTLPGMGANNPAIRLYHYKRNSGLIISYTQFYLNLTEANRNKKARWDTEYSTTNVYNLKNLTSISLNDLVVEFQSGNSQLFQKYYDYNSVSLDQSKCVGECKHRHICSITKIDLEEFHKCILGYNSSYGETEDVSSSHKEHHGRSRHEIHRFTYFLLGVLVVSIVVLFFIIAFCCCNRRHAVILMGHSKYVRIQDAGVEEA